MILTLSGCAAYQHYEASRPAAVTAMESQLDEAGFTRMEADYPDQLQIVRGLPSYSLHLYPSQHGIVYWYYDPLYCGCVYVGNDAAYRKYQWQITQQNDTAAYVASTEDSDAIALNALDGSMFPPSLFLLGMGAAAGGAYYGARGTGGGHGGGGHDRDGGHDRGGGGGLLGGGHLGGGHIGGGWGGGFDGGDHFGSHGGGGGGHGR